MRNERFAMGATLLLVATGCGERENIALGGVGSTQDALFGNLVQSAPGQGLPHGAVGSIRVPGGFCTATLIKRDVVLTSGHCFCDGGALMSEAAITQQVKFFIPATTGQSGFNVTSSGKPDDTNVIGADVNLHLADDVCGNIGPGESHDEASRRTDLACLVLDAPVPASIVPALPKVYTGGDFLAKLGDSRPEATAVGYGGQGWSQNPAPGERIRRSGPTLYHFGILGGGYVVQDDDVDETGGTTIAPEDSGGPLVMTGSSGGAFESNLIFGVATGISTDFFGASDLQFWSPTWDNNVGNGNWLRLNCLHDADDDDISDMTDNCSPISHPACTYSPALCANTDQADTDGDGVGDVCDVCPSVADPDQADADNDYIGDVCDPCPQGGANTPDSDGDGVGNGCDNCDDDANPFPPCGQDSHCGPIAAAFCIKPWQCDGGSCTQNATGWCSQQLDDTDGDGLGGVCDDCEGWDQIGSGVTSNSNDVAEQRLEAQARGDLCDEVPQYVSRPIVQSIVAWDAPGDEIGPQDVVVFESSASIGSSTPTTTKSYNGGAGFRHCSCRKESTGEVLKMADCLGHDGDICTDDPIAFTNLSSGWDDVTVSTGWAAYDFPTGAPMVLNPSLARTFTSTVTAKANPYHDHPNPADDDPLRLGPVELIAWHWRHDATAGNNVPSWWDNGQLRTAGIWWDHALGFANASTRDASTQQKLREHYTYVDNPFASFQIVQLPLGASNFLCEIIPCNFPVRPDLPLSNPFANEGWFFETFRDHLRSAAKIEMVGSSYAAVDGVTLDFALDAGAWLSADLEAMIGEGAAAFVTPVESGRDARRLGDATHAVALPHVWQQSSVVEPVVATVDGLVLARELGALPEPKGHIPAKRSGAQALLSLTERAVFMLGGSWQAGQGTGPTGQIWQYDLDAGSWQERFYEVGIKAMNVRAAAYDYHAGHLLAVDQHLRASEVLVTRGLRFEVRTGQARVVWECERDHGVEHFGLAALESGEVVYVEFANEGWTAWLMDMRGERPVVHGRTAGTGAWHSHPFLTDDGVVVPHSVDGFYAVKTLTEASFEAGSAPLCLSGR